MGERFAFAVYILGELCRIFKLYFLEIEFLKIKKTAFFV